MKDIKSKAVLGKLSVLIPDQCEWMYSIFLQHFHYFGLLYYKGCTLVTGISFDNSTTEEDWFNTSVIYFNILSVSLSVTFTQDTIVSAQWFRHYFSSYRESDVS
jgi:hypothetical protein